MTLLDELNKLKNSNIYPFHMPGHKRRLVPANELETMYQIDITEIDGFDNLHEAEGVIKEVEKKAVQLFGADETKLLVNGSTGGILAAICGLVHEGDKVYMARNCHKSVYNGVMLSGATPIYIYPKQETLFEINAGITAWQVEEALDNEEVCEDSIYRKLVIITSPTYEGVVSNIKDIAEVCHNKGAILLVDAAHGAHFGLSDYFPQSAISEGADVVVTSLHKTLPAPTGTALIHISNRLTDSARIKKMLKVFQTSSPSYPLMVGIEQCIDFLANNKEEYFNKYKENLEYFYNKANDFKNISVLTKDKLTCDGSYGFDKGKIIITDKTQKLSGKQLYDKLLSIYDIQPEMAAGGYSLLMTSIADDRMAFDRLLKALNEIDKSLSEETYNKNRGFIKRLYDRIVGKNIRNVIFERVSLDKDYITLNQIESDSKLSIKDTFWKDKSELIPVELSEGRISSEYVAAYPPGIPIVVPGEVITDKILDEILRNINLGLNVNGINSNNEIEVIWEKSST